MKLSSRLSVCAELITPGNVVADIGTDHGHLPIFLLQNQISPRVLAADLREKPLQFARQNAAMCGIRDNIEFYLSDGLLDIPRGAFRSVVCAGMGGETIAHILEDAKDLWTEDYQFVLQPQSAPYELRQFLGENGFQIIREKLARDGKFVYTVMDVRWGGGKPFSPGQCYRPQGQVERQDGLYEAHITRIIRNLKMTVDGLRKAAQRDDQKLLHLEKALEELLTLEEAYANCI